MAIFRVPSSDLLLSAAALARTFCLFTPPSLYCADALGLSEAQRVLLAVYTTPTRLNISHISHDFQRDLQHNGVHIVV